MSLQKLLPGDPDAHGAHSPMVYVQRQVSWQYKHLLIDLQQDSIPQEKFLNELGMDGWELICMVTHEGSLHVYFKRLDDS